jgi:hypothetical protein
VLGVTLDWLREKDDIHVFYTVKLVWNRAVSRLDVPPIRAW